MSTGHVDTTIKTAVQNNTVFDAVLDATAILNWRNEIAAKIDGNYDEAHADNVAAIGLLRQALINGNFDIWQRGTSFSSPTYNTYTADRFFETGDGTVGTYTISRQAFIAGQTAVPNNPKYFYRHDQTVAGTGQTFRNFAQKIENGSLFAGSQFTLSFYAKADSARTVSCSAFRNYGTGGAPTSAEQLGVNNAIALTTSWQKFTLVVTASSVAGKIFGSNGDDHVLIIISLPINVTFTIDIDQVQVNSGNIALPFQPKSLANELLDCQKYYEIVDFTSGMMAVAQGTTTAYTAVPFKVKKRTTPTAIVNFNANGNLRWEAIGASNEVITSSADLLTLDYCRISTASTTVARNWVSGKVLVDAEI